MARSSRPGKAAPAKKLTKIIVAQNLHESEPQVITSGVAAAVPLESNDHLFGSLGLNHRTVDLSEQGLPTTSFETLGGLKFAESFECISSTALQPAQSDTSKSVELQGQSFETPKSVKEKFQPVDTTQLPGIPGDRILLSAVHRDASAEATLIVGDREFTKSTGYEVVFSPATKSLLKKKLNSALKNLLNFEKGGALSPDYHVYTVKSTKTQELPILFTALVSLGDNVLVIDSPNYETSKTPAKPLDSEIAFDAWLWIPPSVKLDNATTDNIKQLRLILEQDDTLQFETPMLDFLAGKLFDAGEFKPCQPIRLSLMSESQMREDCFYLLSGAPGLERIKEMLRNHSKMLGGSWPSEVHILKVDGR
ncbi:hypothetical protein TWF594_001576 [Orbilia oligospora]|uniref:Uncharacterized protein n=1 Tax=Orbilia oligospora TaxID=2813651 RepID=A0A7C8JFB5_ORBOL|nr:hypothetical protein TWF706_011843 [Orbilia oligospora]KAF3119981.1 hypothetical protein TWF703_002934 [Orbilia oligospora]KAF3125469.1 hypothetical protein TWF594_001576 [Orbilia oligospora]